MSSADTDTFIDDQSKDPLITRAVSPPSAAPPNTVNSIASTVSDSYFDSLDAKYQAKIKAAAQQEKHTIQLIYPDRRTEKQEYVRMKVLQWQFDDIQEMIAKIQESTTASKAVEASRYTTALYKKAAGYYLFNTKTQKPMSMEEYDNCYTSEIRPVLDAAIRLTLLTDPN